MAQDNTGAAAALAASVRAKAAQEARMLSKAQAEVRRAEEKIEAGRRAYRLAAEGYRAAWYRARKTFTEEELREHGYRPMPRPKPQQGRSRQGGGTDRAAS